MVNIFLHTSIFSFLLVALFGPILTQCTMVKIPEFCPTILFQPFLAQYGKLGGFKVENYIFCKNMGLLIAKDPKLTD